MWWRIKSIFNILNVFYIEADVVLEIAYLYVLNKIIMYLSDKEWKMFILSPKPSVIQSNKTYETFEISY